MGIMAGRKAEVTVTEEVKTTEMSPSVAGGEKTSPAEAISAEARAASQKRWDAIAKPLDSLGIFEKQITQIAGITGDADVKLRPASLFVFCADNGIVEEGVTQTDSKVTAVVAKSMAYGKSGACRMAEECGCIVNVIDVGIEHDEMISDIPDKTSGYTDKVPGIIRKKILKGTEDFLKAPAFGEEELKRAISAGREVAQKAASEGIRIFLVGEMGIGNTTTSAALASALLGVPPTETVGRGAGLDDKGFKRKTEVVAEGLEKYGFKPGKKVMDKAEVMKLMHCLGGLDIASIAGFIMGACYVHVPVIIDGVITAVAALAAVRLYPECKECIIGSHVGKEPSMKMLLDELGLDAPIKGELALGEGTGALMELSLLDMALAVYDESADFTDISIDAYKRF